jgi:hypothetical protein
MTKRRRNNIIAILFLAAFVLAFTAFGARAAEWKQIDRDGAVWVVLIPHAVDPDVIETSRKAVDVNVEIITYGASWTRMTLTQTETTDWGDVRGWVNKL